MPAETYECLPCADGSAWILSANEDLSLTAVRYDGKTYSEPFSLASTCVGWSTVMDSDGFSWVAWSEITDGHSYVYVRRAEGENWGLRLQISPTDGAYPLIRADEFGNVWIFWTWDGVFTVCRMGRRSGQPIKAAEFSKTADLLDGGTSGGAIWLIVADGEARHLVRGTEHGGFAPPVALPSL
ncbi:MAG TPA: hypothetical protein VGM37_10960 [Armatimonadota bacterium]|jgi:hypothetical protein